MSQASDMLQAYINAEIAVLSGQSGRIGDRQFQRADLAVIRAGRAEWQAKVDAENRAAAGQNRPRFMRPDFSGE